MGTKREVFHKFQLLKSEVCQNPEKNTECQGHNFLFEQKLKFCNYTCGSSEMVKCMNSPYGMVFFCIPNGTSCPKGIGWQFESIDGNGMVMIKESICPEGYYQVEPSKCHNACRTKHELLEMIPEGFKVVLKGNHIRQTLLMCDYKAGYFNADNKSFVNYDDNFLGHLDFCTHINHSNPCSSGQMPLYNGTCVEPCRPGYERDETDFLCKQVGYVVTSDKDTQLGQPTTSRPTVKPEEPKTTTTDNGHEDDKDKGRGINGKSENSNALPWYMYLIIALVIVGAGIAIIALVIKICCPQRCQADQESVCVESIYLCSNTKF
ncbi:uncharacterized protein LOC128554730 [Mercenaria mercenaria]|uniref:uncharacterized protein LOC128554730 n=1 Tax=Mercenaria mercenaria TaxID=6596 RepID=UPI00234ED52E|nr:uncharacterized protein LOC128554730 [Mercenaria mercenaria]